MLAIASLPILWLHSNILRYQRLRQIEHFIVQALRIEGRQEPYDPWRDFTPLTDPAARRVAQQALTEAQHLATVDPNHVATQTQLGQVALLLNQPETAIAAYSAAVDRQPENSLRWFELGLAYERLAPFDLTREDNEYFWETTAPLVQQWSLPTPVTRVDWWQPDEPLTRTVLVGDRLNLRTTVPITPTMLIFWMGNQAGQPTTYRILIGDQLVGEHELPATAQGWQAATVDLSHWAGQAIELTLRSNHAQAGWGDIQLIAATDVSCALVDCRQRARAAWQRGGFTADQFLDTGTFAFHQQQYTEALIWYQRAALLGADTTSAQWYIRYLMTEDRNNLARSVSLDHGWVNEDLALRAWLRWGILLREEQDPQNAEQALRRAITISMPPTSQWRLSEAYRHLGLALWDQNRLPEALPYLAEAVNLNPRSAWAHIHYGKVLYLVDPTQIDQVEHSFETALALNPRPEIWKNLIGFWQWQQEPTLQAALCQKAAQQGLSAEVMQVCR